MSWSVLRGHALVLVSTLAGITGMGIVFGGAMHGNLHAMMQGTPLLLLGLWWSGRELGRSMMGARALRSSGRSQSEREAGIRSL